MKEIISCQNCDAACCSPGMELMLSDNERVFLEEGGTILKRISPIYFSVEDENGQNKLVTKYAMIDGCGYVVQQDNHKECKVHENPNRPSVCKEYQSGQEDCRKSIELYKKARENPFASVRTLLK